MVKKVLVIVDMQNDFIDPKGSLYMGHDTTKLVQDIMSFAQTFQGDVYLTRDAHTETDVEFEQFPKHCVAGTWGSEIVPQLSELVKDLSKNTQNTHILSKCSYTNDVITDQLVLHCFLDKDTEYYFSGVCTSICVNDIVASLVNKAKNIGNILPKIFICKNLVADFDPEMEKMCLRRMQILYNAKII